MVVANDEFFVDTFVRVAQDDFFGRSVGTAHKVARAEQIDAGDFEFGGGERTGIAANSVFRQMVGQDFALFKQRCDQTIGNTAVRCAFTHGVNACVGDGLQRVCDHNAALAIQAHFFSQGGVGTNAHCHHHQFCQGMGAVLEQDLRYATVGVTQYFLGLCANAKLHATCFQRLLQ